MLSSFALEEAVELARAVAVEVAGPEAARTDREARWPEAALRALMNAGLGGLVLPRSVGGHGLGLRALAQVCETIAEQCASTALCFGMHQVAAAVLAAKATPAQRDTYLVPIAAGRHLTTLSLSEPGTGAQFWLPQTTLATLDGGYEVTGTKSFVTNGGHADSYVVSTVAADPDAPPGMFSAVVAPADTPGMRWVGDWSGVGMRGNSSRTLELDHVRLPADSLLGEQGDQIWYVFEVVAPYFLIAMAGTYLGVAASSLTLARDHLLAERHDHTGRVLAANSILQHRLGELYAYVERTRWLVYQAGWEADANSVDALPMLASAKAEVAACAVDVTNEAMTLAGGIAYRECSPLERNLRDARAAHVMAPTTDVLRVWAGRALLGLPLLGE